MQSRDTQNSWQRMFRRKMCLKPSFLGFFPVPICGCIEVNTGVKQGSSDNHSENGLHILHSSLGKMHKVVLRQEPRSLTQLSALGVRFPSICSYKFRSVSFTALNQKAPLQAKTSGSKASEMGADAFNSLNRDFPIPKTNVPTTELQCKHHSIIHMLLCSTPTSQGHVFLFECRWLWHLSAEIPTAVFKHLKSGLCFYWR